MLHRVIERHMLIQCAFVQHVVFGEVEEGMDVVRQIEAVGSSSGKTAATVKIVNAGVDETDLKDLLIS